MSEHVIRPLRPDEIRASNALFRASLHAKPLSDEEWAEIQPSRPPERSLGAFEGDVLVGTARSWDAELTVPGGAQVPTAMVTDVGVRADRTRRGLLTSLMRAQFADFAERGMVAAALHASEGEIYGRFGYGVGTQLRRHTVDGKRARLHPEAPAGGTVELVDVDQAFEVLPKVYEGLSRAPGHLTRSAYWWRGFEAMLRKGDEPLGVAVHHGPGGADGYVLYRVSRQSGGPGVLRTVGLAYDNLDALAGLWRFLLSLDLVDTLEVDAAPVDEPLELLLTDPRACQVTGVGDDLWVRLVDVPAALAAREYEDVGEPLVLDVDDPVLPANSGRYVVGAGEVRRTDDEPDLRMHVTELAKVYFGLWRPSALVATGRAKTSTVRDDQIAMRADRLLAVRPSPWCGTFF